jgi:hypothetical protein
LNSLLKDNCSRDKRGRLISKPILWTNNAQDAFVKLTELLSNAPVLAYADYSLPFTVHTDASIHGLGAVLYQTQDNKERPIAFASRGLKPSERNYPTHKLEFLALKWAVSDKFHDYLYGHKFGVHTDNNPLTYVMITANLDATGHRWVADLASDDFNIRYRAGSQNTDADALSRIASNIHLESSLITALCQYHQVSLSPLLEPIRMMNADIHHNQEDIILKMFHLDDSLEPSGLLNSDWNECQANDDVTGLVVQLVKRGQKSTPSHK